MTTVLVAGVVVVTVVCGCRDKAHAQRQTMTKTATMETTTKMRVTGTDTPTAIAKILTTERYKMLHYQLFSQYKFDMISIRDDYRKCEFQIEVVRKK